VRARLVIAAATAILLGPLGASPAMADDPPLPTVDITVDPVGRVDRTYGEATVTGTVTCTGDDVVFTDLYVELSQVQNVRRAWGAGEGTFECDGTTHVWSVQVSDAEGYWFRPGRSSAMAAAKVCWSETDCNPDQEHAVVMLRAVG
jgi:hypothetical protein